MYESIPGNENKNSETIKPEELDFESLKDFAEEIKKLAETSFKETDDSFENINGYGIFVKKENGKWRIASISDVLKDFQKSLLLFNDYKYLIGKFDTKEELMGEIRKMIEDLGNRIIE
ncbi:MAG: hypothetical protein KAI71_01585 [Candidatus Pacebacteria bacterium]|nr:hypothetical protein [Candidatus Paceibacterota bacterium]